MRVWLKQYLVKNKDTLAFQSPKKKSLEMESTSLHGIVRLVGSNYGFISY